MGGETVNATALAKVLGVSRPRVSQYVSEGKLDGCFTGSGLNRRFDVAAVAARLNRVLHPGQMLGEGAPTRRRLREITAAASAGTLELLPEPAPGTAPPRDGTELPPGDFDRYELARTQVAEEQARRLRRQNLEADGTLVLASSVESQVMTLLAQEVSEMETALRDGARKVADELGVDFRLTRQLLLDVWREHRAGRAAALSRQAAAAVMTPAETEADL